MAGRILAAAGLNQGRRHVFGECAVCGAGLFTKSCIFMTVMYYVDVVCYSVGHVS